MKLEKLNNRKIVGFVNSGDFPLFEQEIILFLNWYLFTFKKYVCLPTSSLIKPLCTPNILKQEESVPHFCPITNSCSDKDMTIFFLNHNLILISPQHFLRVRCFLCLIICLKINLDGNNAVVVSFYLLPCVVFNISKLQWLFNNLMLKVKTGAEGET